MSEERSLVYVPPGWPEAVRPPGSPGWERSAVSFLLDCCPPSYRLMPAVTGHPHVAAQFAWTFLSQRVASAETGVASIRADLAGWLAPEALEAAVSAWLAEAALLRREQRAVELVRQAMRGTGFVAKL